MSSFEVWRKLVCLAKRLQASVPSPSFYYSTIENRTGFVLAAGPGGEGRFELYKLKYWPAVVLKSLSRGGLVPILAIRSRYVSRNEILDQIGFE